MGVVVPHIGDEQEHLATLHVEGAMENAFGMRLSRHRDTDLFSAPPIAMIEWGGAVIMVSSSMRRTLRVRPRRPRLSPLLCEFARKKETPSLTAVYPPA